MSEVPATRPSRLPAPLRAMRPRQWVKNILVLAAPVARSSSKFLGKNGLAWMAGALGTGIFFSFLGTIFGLIALMIIAPYLAAVAIKFGAFEYCALSIFSLSLVISLAGKDMVKGLAAALLGVIFATFGIVPGKMDVVAAGAACNTATLLGAAK